MQIIFYAGMDIEAPCGRCKSDTRHRILTLTDGTPDNLICGHCNSVHKYRAERTKPEPRAQRGVTGATIARPRPTASPGRFQELMVAEQAGTKTAPYSPAHRWEEGTWMDHPSFGLGRVQKRFGKKVDVLFRQGLKTLISG
jgi:hypothetical protein